jgi:hypothetical protein
MGHTHPGNAKRLWPFPEWRVASLFFLKYLKETFRHHWLYSYGGKKPFVMM